MDSVLSWFLSIWNYIEDYVYGWILVIAVLFVAAVLTGCFSNTVRPARKHLVKADAMLAYLSSSEKRAGRLGGIRRIRKHAVKAERLIGAYAYDHPEQTSLRSAHSSVSAALRSLSSLSDPDVSGNPISVMKIVKNAHKLVSAALKAL